MVGAEAIPAPAGLGSVAELRSAEFRQSCAAEFLASLLLLYVTVGTIVYSRDAGGIGVENQVQISVCVGCMVSVLIFIFGGISGAHFNACFSYACAITGRISWLRCAAFSAAQVAGMCAGTLLVRMGAPALFAKVRGGRALQCRRGGARASRPIAPTPLRLRLRAPARRRPTARPTSCSPASRRRRPWPWKSPSPSSSLCCASRAWTRSGTGPRARAAAAPSSRRRSRRWWRARP
jgi:hypothetical protein